jgi:predicted double-glycine peptidase
MVPIQTHGYNHFVIFRGLWGNRVLLADPAWGNRTMPVDAFEQMWLNYPDFGRVGFVIIRGEGGDVGPRLLTPRSEEFLSLK